MIMVMKTGLVKTNNPGCGEMFCTTCGGIFRRIIEVMGTKTINDIKEIGSR